MFKWKRYAGFADYRGRPACYFWTLKGALRWAQDYGHVARVFKWNRQEMRWKELSRR